jgi:hypothetical protein
MAGLFEDATQILTNARLVINDEKRGAGGYGIGRSGHVFRPEKRALKAVESGAKLK